MRETRLVLGIDDPGMQEEILHFLDRLPRVRVTSAVTEPDALARRIREDEADAVVLSAGMLRRAPDLDGAAVMVVVERETTEALRSALRAGARGFFLWPEEREALGSEAEATRRPADPTEETAGKAIAVYGPRGGAGVTFVATNLAAACAVQGATTALVDGDPFYGEVTAALGINGNGDVRTIVDLVPVIDELSNDHLDRVLYRHPRSFEVLLAPGHAAEAAGVAPVQVTRAVEALRRRRDVVVAHLPRSMDAALPSLEVADVIAMVVTLDVLAFRDARRALDYLAERGLDRKCRLVINRAVRAEVVPEDAERVFGMRPVAVLPAHRSVMRAQNRGELIVGRPGQLSRRFAALATRLLGGGDE